MSTYQTGPWTEKEMSIVRKFYPNYARLAEMLPARSPAAIRGQCRRLNLSPSKHNWTMQEIIRLSDLFPRLSWMELRREFPFATEKMLQSMANKHGIHRRGQKQLIGGRA
ncbi:MULTISPECIES: hypothetical protein [unclassified Phyllobacterium]|uniref:hypothetical protein n=1 Tax=unclassified Phyllobacterium TaxID=2638441 RepID=UPI003012B67A